MLGQPLCRQLHQTGGFHRRRNASVLKKIQATHLILFQGVLYAFGGGIYPFHGFILILNVPVALIYNPCLSYLSKWFVVRRGLAIGVISAGTATGGLLLPLVLPRLIDKYGPPATLRILSIVFRGLLLPALPFLKGRLPVARVHGPTARSAVTGREWTKSRNWNLFMIASTLQAFGNHSLETHPKTESL
jgi:hypothetical protein